MAFRTSTFITPQRWTLVIAMFVGTTAAILVCAESYAHRLVTGGEALVLV